MLGLHASTAEAMGSIPGQEPGGCNRRFMAEKKENATKPSQTQVDLKHFLKNFSGIVT